MPLGWGPENSGTGNRSTRPLNRVLRLRATCPQEWRGASPQVTQTPRGSPPHPPPGALTYTGRRSAGRPSGSGPTSPRDTGARPPTHLVGDAVEHLHGQVGDIRVGVSGQVQQDPPNLGVDAVERYPWE